MSVSASKSELHHYTTISALAGMMDSGAIWATHRADLNDSTEMKEFGHVIRKLTMEYLDQWSTYPSTMPKKVQNALRNLGSPDALSAQIEDVLRKTVIDKLEGPYVFSMCNHEDKYEKNNGLLSQWRGYGGSEPISIVFDTSEYEFRCHEYNQRANAPFFQLSDVIYKQEEAISAFRSQRIDSGKNAAQEFREYLSSMIQPSNRCPESFMNLIPIIANYYMITKHYGFREEHEVRLIVSPRFLDNDLNKGRVCTLRSRWRKRDRTDISYVELPLVRATVTSGRNKHVIKRVIVGPSRTPEYNEQEVRSLLAKHGLGHVCVHRSATPFIP